MLLASVEHRISRGDLKPATRGASAASGRSESADCLDVGRASAKWSCVSPVPLMKHWLLVLVSDGCCSLPAGKIGKYGE